MANLESNDPTDRKGNSDAHVAKTFPAPTKTAPSQEISDSQKTSRCCVPELCTEQLSLKAANSNLASAEPGYQQHLPLSWQALHERRVGKAHFRKTCMTAS